MQQTAKYQFNIIDPSDTFGPEKLNDNAQKLEAALIAHEGTVSSAMTQHKAETDAALSVHRAETIASLSAQAAGLATALSGAYFVKLGEVTAAAANQEMTFNFSGLNMENYAALFLVASAYGAKGARIDLYVNNTTPYVILTGSSANGFNYAGGIIFLIPAGSEVPYIRLHGLHSSSLTAGSIDGGYVNVVWGNISTFRFIGTFDAGSRVTVYALKK